MKYALVPFVAWIAAGGCKFCVNGFRYGWTIARERIGYGGMPSTHTTIAAAAAFLAGLELGTATPVFSIAMGGLLVVIIDAHGLRNHVGEQARRINFVERQMGREEPPLRERMGHTWGEIAGGVVLGGLIAYGFYALPVIG